MLDGVGFAVRPGETLALVGESGSGKSMTALAVMGLLSPAMRVGGSIRLLGREMLGRPAREWRAARGATMSIIFQDPVSALDPVLAIGDQVIEAVRAHPRAAGRLDRRAARAEALALLARVRLPDPDARFGAYPHQLSGGMCQRVMIAMALAGRPRLLIADEPTTALDVTVQSQILELLMRLQEEEAMAMLLITHDLGLVARYADRVAVLYSGRIVEEASAERLFHGPRHPYTVNLLGAAPRLTEVAGPRGRFQEIPGQVPQPGAWPPGCGFAPRCSRAEAVCAAGPPAAARLGASPCLRAGARCMTLLSARGVTVRFDGFTAVDGVDLDIEPGQTVALVGESGSGKSTLARAIIGLVPMEGRLTLDGRPLLGQAPRPDPAQRRVIQMIFQNPAAALNPRLTVGRLVEEPLLMLSGMRRAARQERVQALLAQVGLPAQMAGRQPHLLSGGQKQRVCIARALAAGPRLLIADEAVSALDVSVQGQILNLLADLQAALGTAYLFISHDLSVVQHVADRILVMYAGRVVEDAAPDAFWRGPLHPYARALLAAAPIADPAIARARRSIAATVDAPPATVGCAYRGRCPLATARCSAERPALRAVAGTHRAACHHAELAWPQLVTAENDMAANDKCI